MPNDAEYYFNILVVNIAIRESLQQGQEEVLSDIWDISCITEPRPYVVHLYTEDDSFFEEDENFIVEFYPNRAVEVSASLGVSFYDMLEEDEEDDEEEFDGDIVEIDDPNDLWRL